jgi:chemotaxis protein methyltransferase CheR
MTPQDFAFIRKLLKQRSGLTLSEEKQYLVESRLAPVAMRAGLAGLSQLAQRLRAGTDEALTVQVVEAMTTNETFFFRDRLPFEHFRSFVMPSLLATRARQKRIRIWCAAASTGQEPYSFAMVLKEMGRALDGFRVDIVATDLSGEVLEKAKAGVYTQFEVQRGLPIQMLVKYFTKVGEAWQIAPEIRDMVHFRTLNLLDDFSRLGLFDLVVCRNVLIYFDQETKTALLDRMGRAVAPDGFLILGAAETTVGLSQAFRALSERRGLYVPAGPAAGAAGRVATRLAVAGTSLASRL